MIYTITLNPALDYFMDFRNQEISEWAKTDTTELLCGGKGINVSIILKELGSKNIALIPIGGKLGDILKEKVNKVGISSKFFNTESETRINVKATFNTTYEWGTNSKNKNKNLQYEIYDYLNKKIKPKDIVVISGSVMEGLPDDIIDQICLIVSEKEAKLVLDISGDIVLKTLKHKPFLIKPNVKELGEFFNTKIKSLVEIKEYAQKLIEMGCTNVMVSHDNKGIYLFNKDESIYSQPLNIRFVNGSGAGDSALGGFIHKYLESNNFEKSLNFANASGAGTASVRGIASKKEVINLYKLTKRKEMNEITK